jgi:hypothetical protein
VPRSSYSDIAKLGSTSVSSKEPASRKWHERYERLENEQRLSSRVLPQTVFWEMVADSKIGNETKHVPSKEKAQWRVERICGG